MLTPTRSLPALDANGEVARLRGDVGGQHRLVRLLDRIGHVVGVKERARGALAYREVYVLWQATGALGQLDRV